MTKRTRVTSFIKQLSKAWSPISHICPPIQSISGHLCPPAVHAKYGWLGRCRWRSRKSRLPTPPADQPFRATLSHRRLQALAPEEDAVVSPTKLKLPPQAGQWTLLKSSSSGKSIGSCKRGHRTSISRPPWQSRQSIHDRRLCSRTACRFQLRATVGSPPRAAAGNQRYCPRIIVDL
jgi:hypothetical protein